VKSVLIVSTNADESGAPRHVETIVKNLSKNYKFSAVFGENGPVAKRLKESGFAVFVIKELRSEVNAFKDLKLFWKLYQLVSNNKPDIIHTHSAKASFFGRLCASLAGIKAIYTVHGWGWRGKKRIQGLLIWALEFIAARISAAKYIYVARDVEIAAKKYLLVTRNRGTVIYNGASFAKSKTLAKLKMNRQKITFMMPARVSDAKDHKSLFKAFEMLEDIKYKLILCGAGTNSKSFIEQAHNIAPRTTKKTVFLGQISNIDQYYLHTNVVLLISKYEALPLSIIEAMSFRKCIIATDTGGVSELIDNGVNGILVAKENPYALYLALQLVLQTSVRKNLAKEAFKKYKKRI